MRARVGVAEHLLDQETVPLTPTAEQSLVQACRCGQSPLYGLGDPVDDLSGFTGCAEVQHGVLQPGSRRPGSSTERPDLLTLALEAHPWSVGHSSGVRHQDLDRQRFAVGQTVQGGGGKRRQYRAGAADEDSSPGQRQPGHRALPGEVDARCEQLPTAGRSLP